MWSEWRLCDGLCYGIFHQHCQLYPESNLRMALILSLGLLTACGLGFVLMQSLSQ